MSKKHNREDLKKTYVSKKVTDKKNIKRTYLADDSDNVELHKQDIEDIDVSEDNPLEAESLNKEEEQELSNISEDDLEKEADESKLKKLLKKIGFLKPKRKKNKELNYYNNDLSPSLGNEGLGTSSMSEQDIRKKKVLFSTIGANLLKAFKRNPNFRTEISKVSSELNDVSIVGEEITTDTNLKNQSEHREEHIKQLAHAINDIGMSDSTGEWAKHLSDSENMNENKTKKAVVKDQDSATDVSESKKWERNVTANHHNDRGGSLSR